MRGAFTFARVAAALGVVAILARCGGASRRGSTLDAGRADTADAADAAGADAMTVVGPDAQPLDGADGGTSTGSCAPGQNEGGSSICPPAPPDVGSPCNGGHPPYPAWQCEYGASWSIACDLVMYCRSDGWQVLHAGACACPWGACPPSWDAARALSPGGPCPAASCEYPEGACVCGAAAACGAAGVWSCFLPAAASAPCAAHRPRLGTPCAPGVDVGTCLEGIDGGECACPQATRCDALTATWQVDLPPPQDCQAMR